MPSLASYSGTPPLRERPDQPDRFDAERLAWGRKFWRSQDEGLRQRDRQIEENLRMLAGQQWSYWNPWMQKWQDATTWMTDDERRWRQRPVINYLFYWFMLTHSRLTENQPIVTFQPSSGDRFDAMLAEASDTLYKTVWRNANMSEVNDALQAWLIPGGEAYLMSRINPRGGPLVPWVAPATLELLDQYGQPTGISRQAPAVPFDKDGNPLAQLTDGGESYEVTGEPHAEHQGAIEVDVLSALQCRGQWGPTPWHRKRWHASHTYHTCEEIRDLYGIEVEPDTLFDEHTGTGFLQRALLGTGYYGAIDARTGNETGAARNEEGLVEVEVLWQAPCDFPGMEETPDSPGGRMLITTRTKVLHDGPRPLPFKYTSPLRQFRFVNVPGRPAGSTPQDVLNPIQRAINRGQAQILEHRNLVCNPIGILDAQAGIQSSQITNKPGLNITANKRQGIPAFEYTVPPNLPESVWRSQQQLEQAFAKLGHLEGTEGDPPTMDASGQLVKELRFNSDRFFGATQTRNVEEYGRVFEDWITLSAAIYDRETVINYCGEDNVPQTILVFPEMFKNGRVNVTPDLESMLPEGRGERQKKVAWLYQIGAFGQPGSPDAVRSFMEQFRFPHLNRAARPGGIHRITAEQENGKLVQGIPAVEIPVFEWYDSLTHLAVHEQQMSAPEFLKYDPAVQEQFLLHRAAHILHLQQQAAQAAAMAMQQQEVAAKAGGKAQGAGAAAAAAHGPDQEPDADDPGAASPPSAASAA